MWQLLPFVSQWQQCTIGGPSVLHRTEASSKEGHFWIKVCVGSSRTGVYSLVWDFDEASERRRCLPRFTINTSWRRVFGWFCVSKDTFFPIAWSHTACSLSLSGAGCIALNKLLLCWKKLQHQLAAGDNSWSGYWSAWDTLRHWKMRGKGLWRYYTLCTSTSSYKIQFQYAASLCHIISTLFTAGFALVSFYKCIVLIFQNLHHKINNYHHLFLYPR